MDDLPDTDGTDDADLVSPGGTSASRDLDDAASPGEAKPERRSRAARSAVEWLAVIIGALVIALVVKTYLVQAFYIPSGSMLPTLQIRDRVLVNKLDTDPERGEIIVFNRPGGPSADGIRDLIKRVVALPGELVEGREGRVVVDGQILAEPYLDASVRTSNFGPLRVPAGHVWVMGDNRTSSEDSRVFGPVALDDVVGRAFLVVWPPGQIGRL